MKDVDKAFRKFKEQTGYDFMELVDDKDKREEFFQNNNYEEMKDYLNQCEELYERVQEIEVDTFGDLIEYIKESSTDEIRDLLKAFNVPFTNDNENL